jgi:acetyl-CoA C-acetyltransferase
MSSNGFKDRVAIVAMGCTKFKDHWDKSADDLVVDAVDECISQTNGRIALKDVDAYWVGTQGSGMAGVTVSRPLHVAAPVTRIENYCATGSDSLRNAAYAVGSGAYDMVMAVGVEKLKDSPYSGLTAAWPPADGTRVDWTAPASFSLLAPAYAKKFGLDNETMRDVLTHIAWKSHQNGALNSRAQFRKGVSKETINRSPQIAGQLGVFDCSGVSDGSAAAIVVRAEDAYKYTDTPMFVKALSLISGTGAGLRVSDYDFTSFPEVEASAAEAYRQAGVTSPRSEISFAEVHDCFTPTELVLMEDLGFSERGMAWRDVLDGVFDLGGALPINPDGGLKSFGHPIGASGLRMLFECWLQFSGKAGERQLEDPSLGLTHNLGGQPGECVSFVSIVGNNLG